MCWCWLDSLSAMQSVSKEVTLHRHFVPKPEVSKYCSELMPLLLGYMSCLNQAKVGHVTKAFYALENFMENLGETPV